MTLWRPEAICKNVFGPKFYIPTMMKTEERIEELYECYSHGPPLPTNYPAHLWRPRYHTSIVVKSLTVRQLRDMFGEMRVDGVKVMVMWDPFGPIDWVKDPFERLILESVHESQDGSGCTTVTVRGEDSNQKFNRQLMPDGRHHERRLPVFCDCTAVKPHLLKNYRLDLEKQLERLLEDRRMTEENRLKKLDELIKAWDYSPAIRRLYESPEMVAERNKKENEAMTQKSDSPLGKVFNMFKSDVCNAAMRGGKVALSVGATDEILAKVVRRAVGQYYPEFFIKNPVGRALEPIALAGTVLLGSYLMKAYTSARLPFQDEVEAAAKYSMEGKFRDLVELAKGPLFMVFHQIGAELKESGVTVETTAEETKE
jgi:hypothetical protein